MSNERDELAWVIANFRDDWYKTERKAPAGIDRDEAKAILAAGYSKPRTVTTVEELDALPMGSVVLSDDYRHYIDGWQVSFQRWSDGLWHRGARSSDTHPDNFLPATVLHSPAASK